MRTVNLHYEITSDINTTKSREYYFINPNASNMVASYLQTAGTWGWRVILHGFISGAGRLSSQTPTPLHHHNESETIVYDPMQSISRSTYDLRKK
jgi:hypothetical protein